METDRKKPGEPDRAGDPALGQAPGAASPVTDHGYGYGETPLEPAGAGGPSAADVGASVTEPAGPDSASPDSGPGPVIGSRSATGVREATAPRAVLRRIPEGFPTPPPRPARPNRRPAPTPGPSPAPARPRALVIAGIAVAVVVLLAVAVGGGILALRALSAQAPAASEPAVTEAAPTGPSAVQIGEVTVEEVSTERAVRGVGDSSRTLEPEGEFVIVTFTVRNPTDQVLTVNQNVTLETADGQGHEADQDAGAAYVTDSSPHGLVPVGDEATFHVVFDVPIGSEPTALDVDFSNNAAAGEGALPLGG